MIETSNSWRWRYKIVGETAYNFRKDYDTDGTIALLEEVKTIFKDKKTLKKIDHYIERFKEIAKLREEDYYTFESKHNRLLKFVWDFFDYEGIFIDL